MTDTSPKKKRLPLRWLNLAELVGVAALAIAALGYWDSHRERQQEDQQRVQTQRDKAAEAKQRQAEADAQAKASVLKLTFLMTGTADAGGDKVRLTPAHPEQVIQTQTIWFPTVIRADSVSTTGNPRIEAHWIGGQLGKANEGRMPVAIETVFIEDGQTKTDRSVYLLGYSRHGRLIGGPKLSLEGLSLARRGVSGDLQAAANGFWIGRGA